MLSRVVISSVTPKVHKFFKETMTFSAKQIQLSSKRSSLLISCVPRTLSPRFYSQEANADSLPAVDFDYVKKATLENEVMIIDVREPDEIKELGKIPNSVNIPLGSIDATLALSEKEFQQTYNRPKPKENTELIFYCMIGRRSGKAQQSAVNLGFKNTKNYLGSWTDWAAKNQ